VPTFLKPDPTRRQAVTFPSDGVQLAAHLYRPPAAAPDERTAAVALCGPISSVKEQTLPHYAERLADAGYSALTFDPRGFGESVGEPRFRYDPNAVIEDYHNAVSHLLTREDIDPERVGVVGVCMGGGYAVSVAARDKRLRAVVAIAGGYDIGATFQRALGIDGVAGYLRLINDAVQEQYANGGIRYIPTIAHRLSGDVPIAAMPDEEPYEYYKRTHRSEAPTWSETMTEDSLPTYFIYNAVAHAPLVAPTPLLIVHGTTDAALLPEYAQAAFDAAQGEKELVWIETHNHVELYDQDPYVSEAAAHAIRWLDRHMAPALPPFPD
jgi:fermentation-respiration switch protein FrsA (DUF1100 family)